VNALQSIDPVNAVPAAAPAAIELEAPDRRVLEPLRRAAARCRAARYLDLFGACAMLSRRESAAAPVFADALFRTLDEALGRPPRFYAAGTQEVSFDEAWLVRLLRAIRSGDEPSIQFLIHSRVAPHARRSVGFLAAGVADSLESF